MYLFLNLAKLSLCLKCRDLQKSGRGHINNFIFLTVDAQQYRFMQGLIFHQFLLRQIAKDIVLTVEELLKFPF